MTRLCVADEEGTEMHEVWIKNNKSRKLFEAALQGKIDPAWRHMAKGFQVANLEALEMAVKRLVFATTQTKSSERMEFDKEDIAVDWNSLSEVATRIIVEATSLVLDENFDRLKKIWPTQPGDPFVYEDMLLSSDANTIESLITNKRIEKDGKEAR